MRKHAIFLYVFVIAGITAALAAGPAYTGSDKYPKQVVFDEEFRLEKGGLLEVNVGDMDVNITPASGNKGTVKVTVSGPDLDEAVEYYEKMRFSADASGNNLSVTTEPRRSWGMFEWNRHRRVNVLVEITVPEEFDVDAGTSDGDLRAERLRGEIKLKTSDGDVNAADLSGRLVSMRTSDGDVRAESVRSDEIVMKTSDGDVVAEDFEGKEATMTTSDGDITIKRVDVATVEIGTSDGDVIVKELKARSTQIRTSDGDVDAHVACESVRIKTSDGNINLKIDGSMSVDLSTSDGNIMLSGPSDLKADISMKGSRVRLLGVEGLAIDGDVSSHYISGKLNNGGPKVTVRASDGTVALDLRSDA